MMITTQDQFEEYRIKKTIGMVQGSTIRARHIGTDILAGLRNIVGGEVHEYTKMLAESREQSLLQYFGEIAKAFPFGLYHSTTRR